MHATFDRVRRLTPCISALGLAVALLLGLERPASAARWSMHGPEGNDVTALAIDPVWPGTVYAGTAFDGVFKTTDGGATWQAVNAGLTNSVVFALAVHPTVSGVLYAATNGTVFRTTDGGAIWEAIGSGLPRTGVTALALVPGSPETLYAGIAQHDGGGVFKTVDGGASWQPTGAGMTTSASVRALVVDPSDANTVYAGTAGGGIFKTRDAGNGWGAINTGLSRSTVFALAIDPRGPETVYAGVLGGRGVFKTTDGGGHWSGVAPDSGLSSTRVLALAIDPGDSDTLYAATLGGGVFASRNAGATWDAMGTGRAGMNVAALALARSAPTTLYAGTSQGVFTTTGASWSASDVGFGGLRMATVAVDPVDPSVLYAGGETGGVFKSRDGGDSWNSADDGLPNARVAALAVDPTNPARVYAASAGVFKSSDGATSWQAAGAELSIGMTALVIDRTDPNILWAGSLGNGVFKSGDGGATWRPMNDGLERRDVFALAQDPRRPDILYLGMDTGGVRKTVDAGSTWRPTALGGPTVLALAVDPQAPDTVYAGTAFEGMFRTTDGGATWRRVNTGLVGVDVWTVAIDPLVARIVYAGTPRAGVFRSTDRGELWKPFNEGLPGGAIAALTVHPTQPSRVIAASRGVPVFARDCAGGCPACERCDAAVGCIAAPRAGCRLPTDRRRSRISLTKGKREDGDALTWQWGKGEATLPGDLGDPTHGDDYALCVYEDGLASPRLVLRAVAPAGAACPEGPCWRGRGRPKGSRGFAYTSRDRLPDGLSAIRLSPGAPGKAAILVRGRGRHLPLPTLPLGGPVRVQVETPGGACWEAEYSTSDVDHNDARAFRASGHLP